MGPLMKTDYVSVRLFPPPFHQLWRSLLHVFVHICVLHCPLTHLLAPVRIRCVWSTRSRRARRWPGQWWPEQEVPSPTGSRAGIDALCARHSSPALARSSPPEGTVWENNLCKGMWTEKRILANTSNTFMDHNISLKPIAGKMFGQFFHLSLLVRTFGT